MCGEDALLLIKSHSPFLEGCSVSGLWHCQMWPRPTVSERKVVTVPWLLVFIHAGGVASGMVKLGGLLWSRLKYFNS